MVKVQTTPVASPRNQRQLTPRAFGSGEGIVRANSFTLPKRQNRFSRPLIFLHFSGRSERFDGRSKYLEFCSDSAIARHGRRGAGSITRTLSTAPEQLFGGIDGL
jgi:hypothetical protein